MCRHMAAEGLLQAGQQPLMLTVQLAGVFQLHVMGSGVKKATGLTPRA